MKTTILTDIGDDSLEVLLLVRIEYGVGEELGILLQCLVTVDSYYGSDEGGHYIAANHLAATDVGLVLFFGAKVSPAYGLQLNNVGVDSEIG